MMYGDGWMWGHGWWLMWVVMALVLAALIVAMVVAIRYLSASSPAPAQRSGLSVRPGPETLLAERFARGEIDDDEYRRRLSLLRAHR
jgi:putative membrane protein